MAAEGHMIRLWLLLHHWPSAGVSPLAVALSKYIGTETVYVSVRSVFSAAVLQTLQICPPTFCFSWRAQCTQYTFWTDHSYSSEDASPVLPVCLFFSSKSVLTPRLKLTISSCLLFLRSPIQFSDAEENNKVFVFTGKSSVNLLVLFLHSLLSLSSVFDFQCLIHIQVIHAEH